MKICTIEGFVGKKALEGRDLWLKLNIAKNKLRKQARDPFLKLRGGTKTAHKRVGEMEASVNLACI